MGNVKPKDIERFKRTLAGTIEFAALIEQALPRSREKIISDVQEIDPAFTRAALRKVVYFEEFLYLDEGIVAEILSHTSPKLLAFALSGMDDAFQKSLVAYLNYRTMREVTEEQSKITKKPSESLVQGARAQVLKIARQLEAKNKFVFELADCPRFNEKSSPRLKVIKGSR